MRKYFPFTNSGMVIGGGGRMHYGKQSENPHDNLHTGDGRFFSLSPVHGLFRVAIDGIYFSYR